MGYQSQSKDSRSAYSVSAWILNAGFCKGQASYRGTSGSSLLLGRFPPLSCFLVASRFQGAHFGQERR